MQTVPLHKVGELRVACECCVISGDQVLLQKRPDDSKNFPGFWTLPGGHIDQGEDALTCIMREIKEETGVIITPDQTELKVSAINYHIDRNQTWLIYGFVAQLKTFQSTVSTEEGVTQWFKISDLTTLNLFPPIKYYLDFIIQEKPGILFMAAEWENSELKRLTSETLQL